MTLKNSVKTALRGLGLQKTRSTLTILGIVIGITAIILIMALGKGAQNLIVGQVQAIGSKTIALHPGRQPKSPTDIITALTDSLKQKDLEALQNKANVPYAAQFMPIVFGSETVSYENQTYHPTIMGLTDLFSSIYNVYPEQGALFTDDDVKSYAAVAIIGSKVKDQLFGNANALGEKMKIKNKNFKIVGIFPSKGQVSFLNVDDLVIVPYTTAQQYIFGIKYYNRIVIEADREANVQRTVEDITATLRQAHNIADPSKDDFYIETQAQAMQIVGTITNILTLFLVAVAAISLVVGGIGIMNIMLVTVTERTREIGLRKALGATETDIMAQFLFESVFLTAIGGLIGIILGGLLAFAASLVLSRLISMGWAFAFPFSGALLGLGVSALVGLVFGLYPARQASLKSPIEALRYE